MATHSSNLAWKIPWTEEPGGYSPCDRRESGTTAHAHSPWRRAVRMGTVWERRKVDLYKLGTGRGTVTRRHRPENDTVYWNSITSTSFVHSDAF